MVELMLFFVVAVRLARLAGREIAAALASIMALGGGGSEGEGWEYGL